MRFTSLAIRNFRGIKSLAIEELDDVVVLAGPNGSGKSAVLDAIRLLKSTYGGYQHDEWRQWFSEFQIDLSKPEQLARLRRTADEPMELSAQLAISGEERGYLSANAERLVEELVWRQLVGPNFDYKSYAGGATLATELRAREQEVREAVRERVDDLRQSLELQSFEMRLSMGGTEFQLRVEQNAVLDVLFRHYDPQHLGVIEYHSPSRAFQRSALGGVQLDVDQFQEQRRQQLLYNWQAKYQNIKTELASNYLHALIAGQAGSEEAAGFDDLNATLRELFNAFFPGKIYDGPVATPQGTLEFPVRLRSGESHDIDDLSSGEKEIVYGYLRLRNSAPRHSIILLDEPELHLNPSLLQGLPDFYHQHLGRELGNQIWLVTHSDAILRQAVGHRPFAVFHMRSPAAMEEGEEQVVPVRLDSDVERVVVDLVGDLAAYKPHAKVAILEGGGDTEFDRHMVARLFPELAAKANLVSGGSKSRVRELYDVLSRAAMEVGLGDRFFAVTDRDRDSADPEAGASVLRWDRYHIENYLLEPEFARAALLAVHPDHQLQGVDQVRAALRAAAVANTDRLILEELRGEVNRRLIGAFDFAAAPDATDPAAALRPSIEGSLTRVNERVAELLEERALEERADRIRLDVTRAFDEESWEHDVPGRLVLQRFVHEHVVGVRYEQFRNLIINEMVDRGFRPPGMRTVVDAILSS